MTEYDVVIVGGSIAGCTAATLLARQGARVALLEKSPDPAHYKALCTHELTAPCRPALARLGIVGDVIAIGGEHRSPEIWTRYGWIRAEAGPDGPLDEGLNVRREVLDPLVRSVAAGTDGVDLILGARATGVLNDAEGRPSGVRAVVGAEERTISAALVVGADGRASRVARWTGVRGRVKRHERFGYGAYYEGVTLTSGNRSQFWMQEPNIAYAFPTDSGLTVLATAQLRTPERLAAFKADLDGSFERTFTGLPDGPELSSAQRVSRFFGAIKVENVSRPASAPGVAFVGDAALVTDYAWGAGCGLAFSSATWLADVVGPAIVARSGARAVDRALVAYRRQHRRALVGHYLMTSDYSTGRPFSLAERVLFDAAAHDPAVARATHRIGARDVTPQRILTPALLARAAAVKARGLLTAA